MRLGGRLGALAAVLGDKAEAIHRGRAEDVDRTLFGHGARGVRCKVADRLAGGRARGAKLLQRKKDVGDTRGEMG